MPQHKTTHAEQLVSLRKIEGQVRGLQAMIEEGRYCVDILMQTHSVIGALKKVQAGIFRKHLTGCVAGLGTGAKKGEIEQKVSEIIALYEQFRKG